jgi:hypothetical protein
MRDEPQLVDIFAMVAMYQFLSTAPKHAQPQEIAWAAYDQAQAMMDERNLRYSEGERDDR